MQFNFNSCMSKYFGIIRLNLNYLSSKQLRQDKYNKEKKKYLILKFSYKIRKNTQNKKGKERRLIFAIIKIKL